MNSFEFFQNLSSLFDVPKKAYFFILYILETSLLYFDIRKYSQINTVLSAVFLASKIFNFQFDYLNT